MPKDASSGAQTVPSLPPLELSVPRTTSPYLFRDKYRQRQQENGQKEHYQVGAIGPQALPAGGHGVD